MSLMRRALLAGATAVAGAHRTTPPRGCGQCPADYFILRHDAVSALWRDRAARVGGSFGAGAIGGKAYGAVNRQDSLRALARAEELGCNLVDTAKVYELVLGEFLPGRRSRWIVATECTFQPAGMTATLNEHLARLGTDVIDFYQLHSLPSERFPVRD